MIDCGGKRTVRFNGWIDHSAIRSFGLDWMRCAQLNSARKPSRSQRQVIQFLCLGR